MERRGTKEEEEEKIGRYIGVGRQVDEREEIGPVDELTKQFRLMNRAGVRASNQPGWCVNGFPIDFASSQLHPRLTARPSIQDERLHLGHKTISLLCRDISLSLSLSFSYIVIDNSSFFSFFFLSDSFIAKRNTISLGFCDSRKNWKTVDKGFKEDHERRGERKIRRIVRNVT